MGKWAAYSRKGSDASGDPIIESYVQRVAAAGGTLSSLELAAVKQLLKDYRRWAPPYLLFTLWPCCGSNLAASLVKLIYYAGEPGSFTSSNLVEGDYVRAGAGAGITFDGLSKCLKNGMNAGDLGLFGQFGVLVFSVTPASGNRAYCGAIVGGTQYWLGGLSGTVASDCRMGNAITASEPGTPGMTPGFWIADRFNDSYLALVKNGTVLASIATTATTPGAMPSINVGAFNNNGNPAAFCPCRLGGMHASQPIINYTQITAAWSTFNATLGRS